MSPKINADRNRLKQAFDNLLERMTGREVPLAQRPIFQPKLVPVVAVKDAAECLATLWNVPQVKRNSRHY